MSIDAGAEGVIYAMFLIRFHLGVIDLGVFVPNSLLTNQLF